MLIQSEEKEVVVSPSKNIIKQKQIDERYCRAEKIKSLATLTGGIAQELEDILSIIIDNAKKGLEEAQISDTVGVNLKEIKTAALKATDIIKQLLLFSRKSRTTLKPLKIVPIIEEFLKLIRIIMPENIEIRKDIPKECDTILADATHVHQVIINLCFNAAEAMEEGGLLEISVENVQLDDRYVLVDPNLKPGNYLKICFSDTGKGIHPDNLNRIFDPYFTTKNTGNGAGMGLAVVYGIVKSYRGSIIVTSELGDGTSITIYFPVTD